jgi:hypothetical protein
MLCCKQGESGWLLRHNLLQMGFARVQGLPVEQNVRKSFEDAQQKSKTLEPDAVIYFPERTLWVDFSITEPIAPSAINRNMLEAGSAMNARADLKNAKYLRKAQSMDQTSPRLWWRRTAAFTLASSHCSSAWLPSWMAAKALRQERWQCCSTWT